MLINYKCHFYRNKTGVESQGITKGQTAAKYTE